MKLYLLEVGNGASPQRAVFVGEYDEALRLARRWVEGVRCEEHIENDVANWRRPHIEASHFLAMVRPLELGDTALFEDTLRDEQIGRNIRLEIKKRKVWRRRR